MLATGDIGRVISCSTKDNGRQIADGEKYRQLIASLCMVVSIPAINVHALVLIILGTAVVTLIYT